MGHSIESTHSIQWAQSSESAQSVEIQSIQCTRTALRALHWCLHRRPNKQMVLILRKKYICMYIYIYIEREKNIQHYKYLSIHLSIYLSIFRICLSIYLYLCLCIHLSTYLSIFLPTHGSIYLSIECIKAARSAAGRRF